MQSISKPDKQKHDAFTLIEVLVSIGVIAILIALLIPALAGARSSARQIACLSNLHGIGLVLESYRTKYDDTYPFATQAQVLDIDPPGEGGGGLMWYDPWKLTIYWPALMHDTAPWGEFFGAWVCPGSRRDPNRPWFFELGGMGMSSYTYARSFQAASALWMPGATEDESLLRAVRYAEVQFPASKVVMFDSELAHLTPLAREKGKAVVPMLFVDGHSLALRPQDATLPADNPFVDVPESLHDTPAGVRGRDY